MAIVKDINDINDINDNTDLHDIEQAITRKGKNEISEKFKHVM